MSAYHTITDRFTYRNGEVEISFTATIDFEKLGRAVFRAAKNKNKTKQAGPIKIKAIVTKGVIIGE